MKRIVDRALAGLAAAAGFAAVAGLFAHSAVADPVADFYKGRTVNIVVGHQVGTGFDIYARALARHMGRHIPGNPNIIVQNMVGASGVISANWLYNVAPKDGTAMGTFVHTVPFDPMFGTKQAKFEGAKFTWIGNVEESIGVCAVTKGSGIAKFEDLMTKETPFGATGATGPLGRFAHAVRNVLGAKVRVVSGYKGSASVKIAMQRGEVHGICGLPMSTIRAFWADMYDTGDLRPIIQLSGRAQPELKGIPHIDGFAKTDEDRQVIDLIFGAQALGRIFGAPPNIPADRRDALRKAFLDTLKDEAFIADAKKTRIDISPMSGEEVESFIVRLSKASPAVIERAKQAFSVN